MANNTNYLLLEVQQLWKASRFFCKQVNFNTLTISYAHWPLFT